MRERLQKIIAAAGIASRRKAEELIQQGRVCVNGMTVTQPGSRADPSRDAIQVDGRTVRREAQEYHLVHKPQGVLCARSDPLKRPLVTELVCSSVRLYPAGRLDFQSEGLVILSNDGELTRQVTRSGGIDKVYRVKVQGRPASDLIEKLRRGAHLGRERFAPCRIVLRKRARNCWYEVSLRQGRNRQIRRMFASIGHPVMRLRRVAIGPLLLGNLRPGAARKMTQKEVRLLRRALRETSPRRRRQITQS